MTRGRLTVVGVVLAGVVGLALVGFLSIPAVYRNPSPGTEGRVSARSAASPIAHRPPGLSVADSTPLPPPNAPLARIAGPLRAAAESGNGAAACRLAMEINRCTRYADDVRNLESMNQMPAELLAKPDVAARLAKALTELRNRISRDAAVCDGAPQQEGQAWRLLLAAAMNGHVPSMARFATGGGTLRSESRRGEWDLDALAAYRDHAFEFLKRAAEEGDAPAIERLGTEYMSPGLGTRAVPFEPVRGLAYLKALAARAAPEYRARLDTKADALITRAHMNMVDTTSAAVMALTILPSRAQSRLDGVRGADLGPEDEFGCR